MQLNRELIAILDYFERERGLDRQTILNAIEEGLLSVYRKRLDIDKDTELHIDPQSSEVYLVSPDGSRSKVPELPTGRIIAQNARQMIMQKIRKAEKKKLFEEYHDREGEVVTGLVDHYEKGALIVSLGRIDGVFSAQELTRNERYRRKGSPVLGVIIRVSDEENLPLKIELSATRPEILAEVFSHEIPEIRDGVVEIKGIARLAGEISKVAVTSQDPKIDPVGTCIGMRGTRVRAIMKELGGERIDVIRWKSAPDQLIAATLAPAQVLSVELNEPAGKSRVVVPDDQLAVAIGRKGVNVKLATQLTGYEVEIRSESQARDELLPAVASLPGVDEATARALKTAGFVSLRDVFTAEPGILAGVPGIDTEENAARLIAAARELLDGTGQPVK